MKSPLLAIGLVLALFLAACSPATQPNQDTGTFTNTFFSPDEDVQAKTFASEEELLAFLRAAGTTRSDLYYRGGVMMESAAAAPTMSGAKSLDAADSSSAGGFSGTNNQVANVDEADIIKTDGEYIYTVSGTTLFIIKAYPGEEATIVSRVELESQPTGLFIQENSIVVMGNYYNITFFERADYRPRSGMTYMNVYDISNKAQPTLTKEYKVDGSYFQARMHEGTVYLVTASTPEYSIEFPTPIIFEGTERSSVAVSDVYYFPVPYNSVQFVNVHSMDVTSADITDSKTIAVEGTNTLYMSENNMFLAYTQYINEWEIRQQITMDLLEPKLTAQDKTLIEKIKNVDDDVLSQAEKENKIFQVYSEYLLYLNSEEQTAINKQIDAAVKEELDQYEAMEYTIINKLTITDGAITVGATGKVPGHLNNQFAMDEYEGNLRVATTISARWSPWIRSIDPIAVEPAVAIDTVEAEERKIAPIIADDFPGQSQSTNNVYTLNEDLEVLDSLTGIAPGETIFSTRFIGERLYMVTFRQVDPFFVIDLSDASNIQELGKLKIPGFSRYLHPYDENTIIGIGRDATDLGRQQGLKISLFDVSDVTQPTELAQFVAKEEYSQSAAEYEHKAFLFDKDKELLVIPAYSYNYDAQSGTSKETYNGAMVFRITRDDIELRGIIDHGSSQQYWGSLVERSLYIEELLYTKSPGMLRINELADLSSVQNVTLSGTNASPYPIY